MTDESKQRIAELVEALAMEESSPSTVEMYYRAFPNIQRTECNKANAGNVTFLTGIELPP